MTETTFAVGDRVRVIGMPNKYSRVCEVDETDAIGYHVESGKGNSLGWFAADELERIDAGEVDGDLAGEGVAGPEAHGASGSGTGDQPATASASPAGEAVAPEVAAAPLTEPAFAVRDEVLVLGKICGDVVRIDPDSETPYVVGDAFGEVVGSYHARDLERVTPIRFDPVHPSSLAELATLKAHVGTLDALLTIQKRINDVVFRRLNDLEDQRVDTRSAPTRRRRVAIKKQAKGYVWEGTSEIDGAGPGVDLDALQDAELAAIDRAARRAISAAEYTDTHGLPGEDDIDDEAF